MKYKHFLLLLTILPLVILIFSSKRLNAAKSDSNHLLVQQSFPVQIQSNNGLTAQDLAVLPEAIKRRIPNHLSSSDSAILSIDIISLTKAEKEIITFDNGKIQGKIIKSGKHQYRIVNEEDGLLAVVRKSKDSKSYSIMNSKGGLLFSSEGGYGLIYSIITLLSLLATVFIYFLVYNSIAA